MAYDVVLAARIAEVLKARRHAKQKPMFGGVCFLAHGHMACGVAGGRLVVRVGPEQYESALRKPHARPMDLTGRALRGFVFVMPQGVRTRRSLKAWVDRGARYAASLAPKPGARRRPRPKGRRR